MLDLTKTFNYYELKLFDGSILKLKRPSQGLLLKAGNLSTEDEADAEETMRAFAEFFCEILNRNSDGKVFTPADFDEEYDITVMAVVITDYINYWSKEIANIPFQQSQE